MAIIMASTAPTGPVTTTHRRSYCLLPQYKTPWTLHVDAVIRLSCSTRALPTRNGASAIRRDAISTVSTLARLTRVPQDGTFVLCVERGPKEDW